MNGTVCICKQFRSSGYIACDAQEGIIFEVREPWSRKGLPNLSKELQLYPEGSGEPRKSFEQVRRRPVGV